MPILKNSRHERFAQELAKGKTAREAYVAAGYKDNDGNASTLANRPEVQGRVKEIKGAAAEKVGVTVERILTELARIGFADIRKAVEWQGNLTREQDNPDGGDDPVVKHIFSNHVRLIDSDKLDADTASAIAEVRQSPTGGLSIKLHDKPGALEKLGRHLGMFKDRLEHTGRDGGPIETVQKGAQTPAQVRDELREIFGGTAIPTEHPKRGDRVVRPRPARSRRKKP